MRKIITVLILNLLVVSCIAQYKTNFTISKSLPVLYLNGTGGQVKWAGPITLTQSTGVLTLAGGNLSTGANSILTTGSLGSSGGKLTKGWFTNLEITNIPTINGVPLSVTGITPGSSGNIMQSDGSVWTSVTPPAEEDIASYVVLKHPTNRALTASGTLTTADDGNFITMNSSGATNMTIPLNSSVTIPIGTTVTIFNRGVGAITIVLAGGVTASYSGLHIASTKAATFTKTETDFWFIVGGLN